MKVTARFERLIFFFSKDVYTQWNITFSDSFARDHCDRSIQSITFRYVYNVHYNYMYECLLLDTLIVITNANTLNPYFVSSVYKRSVNQCGPCSERLWVFAEYDYRCSYEILPTWVRYYPSSFFCSFSSKVLHFLNYVNIHFFCSFFFSLLHSR